MARVKPAPKVTKKMKMRAIYLKVPESLHQLAAETADRHGMSMAMVARRWLSLGSQQDIAI